MINNPAFNKPALPAGLAKAIDTSKLPKPAAMPKLGGGAAKKPAAMGVDGFQKSIDASKLPQAGVKLGEKPWNPAGTGEGLGKPMPKLPDVKLDLPGLDPRMIQNKSHGAGCPCC